MKKINTLTELRDERRRLLIRQTELELAMKANIQELKEEMAPSSILASTVGKLIADKNEGLLGFTTSSLVSFLARKIIFKNAGFITKFAATYFLKNAAHSVLEKNKGSIQGWFSSLIERVTNKKSDTDKDYENAEYANGSAF